MTTTEQNHRADEVREDTPETPSFADLGLSDTVLKAVRDLRYTAPTPVQVAAIPEVLAGRDLLAAAQTGTGKTAAFLLPALNNLDHVVRHGRDRKSARGRGPLMLIVTPTRELVQQIDTVCTKIAARTKHIAQTVVGGLSYNPQRSALKRGCDVLVATPGRLVDLIDQGACNLSEVQVLVLDEADRMLDMGFLPDVRKIVGHTPAERQTLLFSATLDEKAVGAITDLVHDPARVEIAPPAATADTVDQYVLPVSLEAKNGLLAQVLKQHGPRRVIVFCRTKHRADACCRRLNHAGIRALPIHGNRSQAQRERALQDFRRGRCDVLVATDVLARGIDITDVRYVVNFDVPEEPTDYIHRIGRTGRAGEVGWALTFVTINDIEEFFAIEALMGKTAELFDAQGLDCGEQPPVVDPARMPAAKAGKKKTKRGKSTSKKKRGTTGRGQRAQRGRRRDEAPRDGEAERVEAQTSAPQASDTPERTTRTPRPARPKRTGKARVREEAPRRDTAPRQRREKGRAMAKEATPAAPARDRGDWSRHDARRAGDWRNGDQPAGRERRGHRPERRGGTRPATGGRGRTTRRPGDGGGRTRRA